MKKYRAWGLAALASLVLAACGGGGDGDQSPRVHYSKLVVFGDSLSDVGSYRVGLIDAVGGGEFSVNNANRHVIWSDLLATQLGVGPVCAAQTGLQSTIPAVPAVPVENHPGCFGYAQGGSLVTSPIGVANAALPGPQLGQLTVPVITQIQNHLAASGGRFGGDELVTVLSGGNDVFINLSTLSATVGAGGDAQAAGQAAVVALGTAGAELAAYVKQLMIGQGATHVVVVTLPDVSQTPFAATLDAATQGLINTMVVTFNQQLQAGLAGTAGVLIVDAYTQGRAQNADPAQYSLTNITTPACDLTKTALPTSLVCTGDTLIAGDTSHYEFADTVHPTPFGYELLARYVISQMLKAGWL